MGNVSVFLDDFKTIYVASLATFMLNIIHPQTLWGILDITVTYSYIFCANLVKTDVFYERTSTSYDTEVVGTHDTEIEEEEEVFEVKYGKFNQDGYSNRNDQ